MDVSLFPRGLVIGLAIAAPVGAIGVLCIQRTLAEGSAVGLVTGLGAATADALYGAVAAFGLTAISGLLVAQQAWVRLLGGLFLCYLGARTIRTEPVPAVTGTRTGWSAAYGSTLLLTLANPTTILSFVAVFAGFGAVGDGGQAGDAAMLVAGVFFGSALWWLILSLGVGALRRTITPGIMRRINQISGATIFAFGLLALISLVR